MCAVVSLTPHSAKQLHTGICAQRPTYGVRRGRRARTLALGSRPAFSSAPVQWTFKGRGQWVKQF
eukprot:8544490-Alexandrium_andersonii.AAC.1